MSPAQAAGLRGKNRQTHDGKTASYTYGRDICEGSEEDHMHSQLNTIVARERIADLHRSAYRARRRGTAVSNGALATVGQVQETISIRRAGEADSAALLLLAELDSSPPLSGDVLIAHVADEPRAA